ncbi:hypothetical protein C7M84_010485 [Penaeus vannamei]|uniref:Uncharacterized protein n=1 Tax=Penaeus vannamei TaxID=6689 RepID=A0A3R7QLG3_PENVA|nr:hypothetical protein C7M84_010485 [Penaeus vannamei]
MRKFVAVALLFAQACIAWENFVYPLGHAGTCLEAGTTCLACNALVNCIATEQGLESLVIPCPPDSKCHVEGGVASCFQESEVPECTCSSLGVFPDPYSARHYFICYPEDDDAMTAVEAKCPEGTVFMHCMRHQYGVVLLPALPPAHATQSFNWQNALFTSS